METIGENMSMQNQKTAYKISTDHQDIQAMKMPSDTTQKFLINKIFFMRKLHLLIAFSEASLATELDKNREQSSYLHTLEWNNIAEYFSASEAIYDIESRNKTIDLLLEKIHTLRIEVINTEKEAKNYLAYKIKSIKKENNII